MVNLQHVLQDGSKECSLEFVFSNYHNYEPNNVYVKQHKDICFLEQGNKKQRNTVSWTRNSENKNGVMVYQETV